MNQINTIEYEKKYTSNGYILIFVDGIWKLEHKYIVEQLIGRELTKEEVVHHLNFCRQDNRISNLMLFKNQREHQKFHNKLKRYGYYTNPMKRQIAFRWKDLEVENEI